MYRITLKTVEVVLIARLAGLQFALFTQHCKKVET